jgi:hypothetical protein
VLRDLVAVQTSAGGVTLELSDLHGDVVAEIPNSATASRPTPFEGSEEFGVPRPPTTGGAIQKVGSSVTALTTAGSQTTIAKPSGTARGDLLVAQILSCTATITPPAGWTAVPGGPADAHGPSAVVDLLSEEYLTPRGRPFASARRVKVPPQAPDVAEFASPRGLCGLVAMSVAPTRRPPTLIRCRRVR